MKLRVRTIAMASESFGISPLLPAFAVVLITLFAWSLAQAAPVAGLKGHDATYRLQPADIAIKRLPIDGLTNREAAMFSTPAPAPSFESYQLRPRIRETN